MKKILMISGVALCLIGVILSQMNDVVIQMMSVKDYPTGINLLIWNIGIETVFYYLLAVLGVVVFFIGMRKDKKK